MNLKLPKYAKMLWKKCRYKVLYGGRGSAKSWTIAIVLIIMSAQFKLRILCTRELQASIKDSVHKLLSDQIYRLGMGHLFEIGESFIRCPSTGSEFIFKGLRHNVTEIKSLEGIDIVWIEEGQSTSAKSWETIIPTIRKDGSEIWVSYNPDDEKDPTHQMFVMRPMDVSHASVVRVSWRDNPWFPAVLEVERKYMQRTDPDAYEHIWEGNCRKFSGAQVFRNKWIVDEFTIDETFGNPYHGADWGFSQDPMALVQCYIKEKSLYIPHEIFKIGCEIDDIPATFDRMPNVRKTRIRADNARPETISYVKRKGFDIIAADKWKGSVEDGVAFLRSFEKIVIHDRCKEMAQEAKYYSHAIDKLTGDILPDIIDKHNHGWDGVRYALQPMIKQAGIGGVVAL